MDKIEIYFVPETEIYPSSFGRCFPTIRKIKIAEGLSRFEICSLLVHEFGHLDDIADNEGKAYRELESISMSMFYPIIGTIIIAFKSLTPTRLKNRWKDWVKK